MGKRRGRVPRPVQRPGRHPAVAALVSAVSGNVESTVVILAVLVLNAVLGTVQTVKAEQSLAGLKAMSAPHAKVRRRRAYRGARATWCLATSCPEAGIRAGRRPRESFAQSERERADGESEAVEKSADAIEEGQVPSAGEHGIPGSLVTTAAPTRRPRRRAWEPRSAASPRS
ncbi:MAG: hypothetical protein ACLSVD_18160 [Eggerthellaceae bacterium]